MKKKLTATLPDGTVATRTTDHEYQYVAAWSVDDGQTYRPVGWSRTYDGAQKLLRAYYRDHGLTTVVAVTR